MVLTSQRNARNELAEQECINVTTASVLHRQRFVMEIMIARIGLMKSTVIWLVRIWNLSVDQTEDVSSMLGYATEIQIVKMLQMKILPTVVSVYKFTKPLSRGAFKSYYLWILWTSYIIIMFILRLQLNSSHTLLSLSILFVYIS